MGLLQVCKLVLENRYCRKVSPIFIYIRKERICRTLSLPSFVYTLDFDALFDILLWLGGLINWFLDIGHHKLKLVDYYIN